MVSSAAVSVSVLALFLAAGLFPFMGPPVLPPESTETTNTTDAPPSDSPAQPDNATPPPTDATPPTDAPPTDTTPEVAPPPELAPPQTTLPPGLEPVPFPLDNTRRTDPTPLPSGDPTLIAPQPTSQRRSIVDLRDPFDRPPPRPRPVGHDDSSRLLMPDLKDPFAPGLARVRSQRLDMFVPNDIRDPFRDRPRGPQACVRTTQDGTVVQKPGSPPAESQSECTRSMIDLRDPFTREQ